jgi:hypothetical protein
MKRLICGMAGLLIFGGVSGDAAEPAVVAPASTGAVAAAAGAVTNVAGTNVVLSAADRAFGRIAEAEAVRPAGRFTNRDEFVAWTKTRSGEVIARCDAFRRGFPEDARRWGALLTALQHKRRLVDRKLAEDDDAGVRRQLEEILSAPDADANVKAGASLGLVLRDIEALKSGGDLEAAVRRAVDHMNKYPEFGANGMIATRFATADARAEKGYLRRLTKCGNKRLEAWAIMMLAQMNSAIANARLTNAVHAATNGAAVRTNAAPPAPATNR